MSKKKSDDWLRPRDHSEKSHVYRCRSRSERQVERVLQDWFGDDAALEIESHQGEPVPLGEVMDDLLNSWDKGETVTLRALVEKWHEIIGVSYKPYTRPALLEDGVLSIEVFSAPLLVNLKMLESEILSNIQKAVGTDVKEIRLIPGGRSSR